MNKLILVMAAMMFISGCTNNEATGPVSVSKGDKKALIEGLGPSKKTGPTPGRDNVTIINANSYNQRGLTFDRYDKSTLRLRGFGVAPSVILQGGQGLSNLPITDQLRLVLDKVGPGGVDRSLGKNFTKGLDIYVIAKADSTGAALIATPTGSPLILPAGYTQKSEMLWFIAVFNGEMMRFRDIGNGECMYLNAPISDRDFRFNKNDRSVTALKMEPLVPVKASKATLEIVFFGDADLPPGSALTFKTQRHGFDIYTYYPLTGLSQRQQQQFLVEVPVESTNRTNIDNVAFSFSSALLNSSSSASFTAVVKGWRLYKNF